MSEGYEETPTTTTRSGGASGQTQTQAPSRGRPDLRGRSFTEQEALLRPPVQAKPAKAKQIKPLAGNLTGQIAMEDGETEEFVALLEADSVKVAKPAEVYKTARQKHLGGDPRMHTLAGLARGVDGTWPTPKLIAEVCIAQSDYGRSATIDGYPTPEQLSAFLRASLHGAQVEENKDLFGRITGRDDGPGKLEANPAHRRQFNARSEPFLDTACQALQICERYGACTKNRARCSTQATTATCQTKTVKVNAVTASTTQQHFPGGSLVADHLIDGRYDTAWAPEPTAPYPHRLTFELSTPMRIAGFRVAGGHHKIDRDEGVLVHAFGFPLGVALFADGVVQDAYQLRRQATWQTQLVSPVWARVVTLELFDHETGKRYDHYAITEIELLVCE